MYFINFGTCNRDYKDLRGMWTLTYTIVDIDFTYFYHFKTSSIHFLSQKLKASKLRIKFKIGTSLLYDGFDRMKGELDLPNFGGHCRQHLNISVKSFWNKKCDRTFFGKKISCVRPNLGWIGTKLDPFCSKKWLKFLVFEIFICLLSKL